MRERPLDDGCDIFTLLPPAGKLIKIKKHGLLKYITRRYFFSRDRWILLTVSTDCNKVSNRYFFATANFFNERWPAKSVT
jgi:hypothetical protein